MSLANIFILDDDPQIRHGFQILLKTRGFNTLAARDSTEARERISSSKGDLDVAVLDMRLDESRDLLATGDQVGLTIREHQSDFPPEFIIYSGFSDFADYYRRAVSLGVATYLEKGSTSPKDVIRHIRALALRRSLNIQNPQMMNDIEQVSQSANGLYLATSRFASETLSRKMNALLGVRVLLFLSEHSKNSLNKTLPCGEDTQLPQRNLRIYDLIQKFVFLGSDRVLPVSSMRRAGLKDEAGVLEALGEAIFVPLAKTRDLALSMAILQLDSHDDPLAENENLMAAVSGEYLRDAVVQPLLEISARWAQAEERRSRVPRVAAGLLHRVGREQLRILDEVRPAESPKECLVDLAKLRDLGEELLSTGAFLRDLADTSEETDFEIAPLIKTVWGEVTQESEAKDEIMFTLDGACTVRSEPKKLSVVLSGILSWLVRRCNLVDSRSLQISVLISTDGPFARIQIEDKSSRLDRELRQRLFDPFSVDTDSFEDNDLKEGKTLQLLLMKILAESQPRASLTDETETRNENFGHRFLLSLPRSPKH